MTNSGRPRTMTPASIITIVWSLIVVFTNNLVGAAAEPLSATISHGESYRSCDSHGDCNTDEFCGKLTVLEQNGPIRLGESSSQSPTRVVVGACMACSGAGNNGAGCVEDNFFDTAAITSCKALCPSVHQCDQHGDCGEVFVGGWCTRNHQCKACSSDCGSYDRIHNIRNYNSSIDGSCPESCCDWGLATGPSPPLDNDDVLSPSNYQVFIGACDSTLDFKAFVGILSAGNYSSSKSEEDYVEEMGNGFDSILGELAYSAPCQISEYHFGTGYPRKVVAVDCETTIREKLFCNDISDLLAAVNAPEMGLLALFSQHDGDGDDTLVLAQDPVVLDLSSKQSEAYTCSTGQGIDETNNSMRASALLGLALFVWMFCVAYTWFLGRRRDDTDEQRTSSDNNVDDPSIAVAIPVIVKCSKATRGISDGSAATASTADGSQSSNRPFDNVANDADHSSNTNTSHFELLSVHSSSKNEDEDERSQSNGSYAEC